MFQCFMILHKTTVSLLVFSVSVSILPSMRDCSIKVFHIHLILIVLLEYFKVTTTNFMTILIEYDLKMYKSTKRVSI